MKDLVLFGYGALIGGLAFVLLFCRKFLRDKPHPDEQRYPPHRPLRVVRAAPEQEDVTA